jgi:hypothetical protein
MVLAGTSRKSHRSTENLGVPVWKQSSGSSLCREEWLGFPPEDLVSCLINSTNG